MSRCFASPASPTCTQHEGGGVMVQVQHLQLSTCGEPLGARIAARMFVVGLHGTSAHELLIALSEHVVEVSPDQYVVQRTGVEIADMMGCTDRAVRKWIKQLRTSASSWLTISGSRNGTSFLFNFATETEQVSRNQLGTQQEPPRNVLGTKAERTRNDLGTDTDGTEPATHTGVTITPPSDTTYPQKGSEASERASGELSSFSEWVNSRIRSAGFLAPSAFSLDVIVQNLMTALDSEGERRAFVDEKLADLSTREQRPGARLVEKALREDCHGWKRPVARPAKVEIVPAGKAPISGSRPSNAFESEGHEDRFARAVEFGTRNLDTLDVDMTEHNARQRQAELEAMWDSLVLIGVVKRGQPIDEDVLREFNVHPDQRNWGVLG